MKLKGLLYALLTLFTLNLAFASQFHFIENKGQLPKQVLFYTEIENGFMFFEKDRITYNLFNVETHTHSEECKYHKHDNASKRINKGHAFQEVFLNANPKVRATPADPLITKYHYYKGKDPKNWVSNAKSFSEITYYNIYDGIDLKYYNTPEGGLKFDFIVAPYANPGQIKVQYEHVDEVQIKDGQLIISNSIRNIVSDIPYTYQETEARLDVESHYAINHNVVGYKLGRYNNEDELVIDPELVFSTLSGSKSSNYGYSSTYDSDGFLYGSGVSFGPQYPVTFGAFDVTYAIKDEGPEGPGDIVISKVDTSGSSLLYSAYFGGTDEEHPISMITNDRKELLIYGITKSDDMPVTRNALLKTKVSGPKTITDTVNTDEDRWDIPAVDYDICLIKISADGSELQTSSYLGGYKDDGYNSNLSVGNGGQFRGEIDIDNEGNIYIASTTSSNVFQQDSIDFDSIPKESTPVDDDWDDWDDWSWGEQQNALLLKFNRNMDTLYWHRVRNTNSTFASVDFTLDNTVFVAGTEELENGNNLPKVLPSSDRDKYDYHMGIIYSFNSDGDSLNFTGFGSIGSDYIQMMDIDDEDQIYITGVNNGDQIPITPNTYSNSIENQQYVAKISTGLDTILWFTKIGGLNELTYMFPTAFMVDYCGRIYMSFFGTFGNTDMPITSDALYKSNPGQDDFYLMVLDENASDLIYASFMGGRGSDHTDGGTSRFDKKGVMYQTVCHCGGIAGGNFPTSTNAYAKVSGNSGGCNMAMFKLDFEQPLLIAEFDHDILSCEERRVQFRDVSTFPEGSSFYWDFGDSTTSTERNPLKVYDEYGDYMVKLVVQNLDICNLIDSISIPISVRQKVRTRLDSIVECVADTIIGFEENSPLGIYNWDPAFYLNNSEISNPRTNVKRITDFVLLAGTGVCVDTFDQYVDLTGDLDSIGFTADKTKLKRFATTTLRVEDVNVPTYLFHGDELVDSNQTEYTTEYLMYDDFYKLRSYSLDDSACFIESYVFIELFDIPCNENYITIPNALTPNQDGLNEALIIETEILETFTFKVFDRWGHTIYEGDQTSDPWDGTNDGDPIQDGVYMYILDGRCWEDPVKGVEQVIKKGDVTIFK